MDLLSNRSIVCLSLLIILLSVTYNHCSWECIFKLLSFLPVVGSRFSSIPKASHVASPDIITDAPKTPINRPAPEVPQEYVPPSLPETPKINEFGRIFTPEELLQYAGEKGLYLSVLGIVYDVGKGEKFYGKGHQYHHFAGRDASRAFVTGDFTKDGLRDDVLDLKPAELLALQKWTQAYEKDYTPIGRLIGRYYDEDGKPTDYLKDFEKAIERSHASDHLSEERKKLFPPCNSEWIKETGGKVWCTNSSGGVERDWAGLPRLLFEPETGKTRCACIPDSELSNANVEEYPNCAKDSDLCITE